MIISTFFFWFNSILTLNLAYCICNPRDTDFLMVLAILLQRKESQKVPRNLSALCPLKEQREILSANLLKASHFHETVTHSSVTEVECYPY